MDVCDDGSTDDTVSIAKANMKKRTVVYVSLKIRQNQGYIRNFMSGIVRCDSPYIMLCDQDDIWNWDKVELTLEKNETDGEKIRKSRCLSLPMP